MGNRLREENISPIGTAVPRLNSQNRVARLHFAREHSDWGLQEWSNERTKILFHQTDVCLVTDSPVNVIFTVTSVNENL